MERLLQVLDELDDLLTMLRQLWLVYGPPPEQRLPRPSAAAAGRALALSEAAAAGG